jgi:hypothetical protein
MVSWNGLMKRMVPWQLYGTVFSVRGFATAGELQIVLRRNHHAKIITARMHMITARRTLRRSFTPALNGEVEGPREPA